MKKPILNISELDLSKQYTYADYLTWQFTERVELVKGWIKKMSPAPKRKHQRVVSQLHGLIWSQINKEDNCQIFDALFDVRLKKNKGKTNQINTVVQPDICIICDKSKLDEYGCLGAPDMIIEILSQSTTKYDYTTKFNLYEQNGVKEYWLVNPEGKSIDVYQLINNKLVAQGLYEPAVFKQIAVGIFPKLVLSLAEIFKD